MGVKYEILPCGVDTDFFQPKEHQENRSTKHLVFPGDPKLTVKNFALFEKVMQRLEEDAAFEFSFSCIQNLSRSEVRNLLADADCLLMTSVSEGSPQIIKEALSCNLPVVSVDVGDVKEMVSGIPSCAVSESGEVVALASLVTKALKDRSREIRNAFLSKHIYDNQSICQRLADNYASHLR